MSEPEPVPARRWTTVEASRLADLVSLADDLDFVVQACRRLQIIDQQEDRDPLVVRALWNASLIAYARCWASGVRVGLSDSLLDQLPGDGRGFHDHLISLRGKHIAHSVNPFEDVAIGIVMLPAGTAEDGPTIGIAHLLQNLVSFESQGLAHFETLAAFLSAEVAKMYQAQWETVQAEVSSMDTDALMALPELQLVTPGPPHATVSRARRAETE